MRIALNAQLLSRSASYRSGGINRVIDHLLREFARDPRGFDFEVFAPEASIEGFLRFHATGAATTRPAARIAWEQTLFPARLAALKPNLVHGMAYALPFAWRGPSVVSVYDLSFLRYPRAFKPANRMYLTAATRAAARRARRVLTISEHSRADIARLLGVPEQRVDVTYPAVEQRYRVLPTADVEAFRAARNLPATFIFSLGTLEPRKNLAGLLAAYAGLDRPRPPLYVAGATGWRYSPIFQTVERLALQEDVCFLGFVPEQDLPLWYNAARLFAFPSLYEGFGLPVLEAMASGTPVITSSAASLPEVAGKAAILVSPTDTSQLAREMQRVLEDRDLHTELQAAGRIQASRFSWRAMADQTAAAYRRALTAQRA